MKRYARPRETLIFVLIAVLLMILIDMVVLRGRLPYNPEKEQKESHVVIESQLAHSFSTIDDSKENKKKLGFWEHAFKNDLSPEGPQSYPFSDQEKHKKFFNFTANNNVKDSISVEEPKTTHKTPPKKYTSIKKPSFSKKASQGKEHYIFDKTQRLSKGASGNGKIVIIIDDMGMSKFDAQIYQLPAPLTLSYLPYAKELQTKTHAASQAGHELMLHVPMEPLNSKLDLGPSPLLAKMKKKEFNQTLEGALNAFSGYVGVNNHMGSRLTQDPQSMIWLMQALHKRNLLFVDSKTIETSLAGDMAYSFNLPYAERDVFLDHYDDPQSIRGALKTLETIAAHKGYAIAIGHPKENTVKALAQWLPSLKSKNLSLTKISDLVKVLETPQSSSSKISSLAPLIKDSAGKKLAKAQGPKSINLGENTLTTLNKNYE